MKTAIYARESSKDTDRAPDINKQIDRAKDYTREKNLTLVDIFADNGYSGGQWNRPGLNNLLKAARANRFKFIVVWNTDRLARDIMHFADIFNRLNEKQIKVYSMTEGWIDMETAGGRIKHNIVAAVNQYEREKTGEKVRMAYQMKRTKGENNWGRPRTLTSEQIMQILELNGTTPGKIKKFLNLQCSVQTIRRVLKDE